MIHDDSSRLQSELIANILDDPSASRESKLIALMSERQLALFESMVDIREAATKTNKRVEGLSGSLQDLTERVAQLEDRFSEHEGRESSYWQKIENHYKTCPSVEGK